MESASCELALKPSLYHNRPRLYKLGLRPIKRHRCCVVDQKPHIRYTLFKECNCSSVNCIAMIIGVLVGLSRGIYR